MKNKGFTLVELLAVIVLLALISLIAIPAIVGVLRDSRIEMTAAQINSVENSARNWLSDADNIQHRPAAGTKDCTIVSLRRLQRDGFADMEVLNIKDEEALEGFVTIKYRLRDGTDTVTDQLTFKFHTALSTARDGCSVGTKEEL